MVGGRMGRGKLHGFIAGGVNLGFFLKKDWEEVRYRDDEAIMKIGSGEFGVLMEGGLDYDLGKHFQVSVNYRYSTVQHSTFIRSLYPLESSNWFVKRKGPGLALGWRI